MKLIFSSHSFKYETESLCKLFFPCTRFTLLYEDEIPQSGDFIFTRVKKGEKKIYVYAMASLNGMFYRKSFSFNRRDDEEKESELLLCRALYVILSKFTGIFPKWGVLTGIRPVKRVLDYLLDGKSEAWVIQHMKSKYLVSEEKIKLALQTAKAQIPIVKSLDNFSFSLYVSIPFCPSRCSYCSFISQSAADKKIYSMIPEYLSLLEKELELTAQIAKGLGLSLKTVYIGGGTPTVLSPEQISRLGERIEAFFDMSEVKEYTIEAGRPDSITEDKLRAIKAAGATRISINPQTLNDEVLKEIGRRHTVKEFLESFELARKLGFDNINTDFIAGLPKDTPESFKNSIDRAISLSPENITVHTLAMKKAARLYKESEGLSLEGVSKKGGAGEMVEYAAAALSGAGYHPYYLYRQKNTLDNLENVGYAKLGKDCLYNTYIMEETHTILACGAAASTKLVNIETGLINRVFNYKYSYEYIKNFDVVLERKGRVKDFYEREFSWRYKE